MLRKAISFGMAITLIAMIFAVGPVNFTARADGERNYEAYFREKTLGGSTWGPYTRLSNTPTYTGCVMVASNDGDPGHIVVVFADNLTGQFDWYFTESLDYGVTWSAPAVAVDPSFDIIVSDLFCSALDMGSDGVVHMSFARQKQYDTNQPTGIYYARYDGTAWSAPIIIYENLSPGKLKLYTNDITVGENHDTIHLAYGSDRPGHNNGDTWYSKSTDGGVTWSTPVNINQDNTMDVGYRPSLAADANGNVYKANDGGWPGWIWFRRSQDSGNTWNNHLQVGKTPYEHRKPLVMCDNTGGVYMVYMRQAPGEYTLMYKYSSDYGATWAPSQQGGYILMSSVPGMGTWYLAELDDAGYIHIVYGSTETGAMEAYYMKIDGAGNIITPPEIITPDDGYPSYLTGLSVKDGHVYFTAKDYALSAIPPTIDIDPDTLNLKSRGNWITCYIDFEDPFNESEIDISTVAITDVNGNPVNIPALWGDMQYEAGGSHLMVKFDRSDVQDVCDLGNTTITVSGELVDGSPFDGSDTIRVINPP